LLDHITIKTTFEVGVLLEENSEDSTELGSSVDLDHVSEDLVEVARNLNEAGHLFLVLSENGVDSLDGLNGGDELTIDEGIVSSGISGSLVSKVAKNLLDGGIVSLSSGEIGVGGGLSVF
jgi:hypothetical protein